MTEISIGTRVRLRVTPAHKKNSQYEKKILRGMFCVRRK